LSSALVLQTQDNCPPGLLCDWAEKRAVELDVLRVDRWEQLPSPAGYVFVVVLGSDASVVGPLRGWVPRVLDWIGAADAVGVPVLGICFGAQALAAALGGSAIRLDDPEQAWIELQARDTHRVPEGPWLAIHQDGVVLPAAARELAHNEFGIQAFSIGGHLGVQFHPEVTPSILARWVADKGGLISSDLLIGVAERCRLAADSALKLFDAFVGREGPWSNVAPLAGVR
jgi:GMP synthase-like glutamine amidotransferase